MKNFKYLFVLALFLPLVALAKDNILLAVPFTVQAPQAEWKDSRFQDACEEASVLMAVKWAQGKKIAATKAGRQAIHNELIKIAAYETKNYKNYHDTSAADTATRLLSGYYQYDKWEVKNDITIKEMIAYLEQGKIIIVPTDGRLLKNPYFTAPGPARHMLVIKGYNYTAHRFITNDPGTKRGENYQYSEKVLYSAMVDYPTGYHEPILKINKNAIIISK